MGITLVTAPPLSPTTPEAVLAGGEISSDQGFAALLSQQIASANSLPDDPLTTLGKLLSGTPGNPNRATPDLKDTSSKDERTTIADDESLASDPALSNALAMLFPVPGMATPQAIQSNTESLSAESNVEKASLIEKPDADTAFSAGFLSVGAPITNLAPPPSLASETTSSSTLPPSLIARSLPQKEALPTEALNSVLPQTASSINPGSNSAFQTFMEGNHGNSSEDRSSHQEPASNQLPPGSFTNALAAHDSRNLQNTTSITTSQQHVATPLHAPNWAEDFGNRVVWASRNDQHTAQISITPEHLGPVQITLNINGDQVSAAFSSPHAEVRQAIEDSLPRLREILSGNGITLGETNVGAQQQQQQQAGRENPAQFSDSTRNGSRYAEDNAILRESSPSIGSNVLSPLQRGRGLVDLFA